MVKAVGSGVEEQEQGFDAEEQGHADQAADAMDEIKTALFLTFFKTSPAATVCDRSWINRRPVKQPLA